MRISGIEVFDIKLFDQKICCDFSDEVSVYGFSGRNGAGKSTVLKSIYLVQKAYFCNVLGGDYLNEINDELTRYYNSSESYIKVSFTGGNKEDSCTLTLYFRDGNNELKIDNIEFIRERWNVEEPKNIILYVDASKSFSENTLKISDINISYNSKSDIILEAILKPERLFSGMYRQLVKDHVHGRLIPSKPDRLLYLRIASAMFKHLIPNVEVRNFSGQHKPGEFVLLGKANTDKRKPLYDVREFSSGEKSLLSTLSFLCISKSVSAILIDEPENHFHESLLIEFINLLVELCAGGGIKSWLEKNDREAVKLDFLGKDYDDYCLNQIFLSTHSRALIYKVFNIGHNYIIGDAINLISYEDAEVKLRDIGISTIYKKILFVEGRGDNDALESVISGSNVKIINLEGCRNVIDTFKRISSVISYIHDMKFVFMVDSDNKPDSFFRDLEKINPRFYQESFIKLEKHEFENYYLDPVLFSKSLNDIAVGLNFSGGSLSEEDINVELVSSARSTFPEMFKKELSNLFNMEIDSYFSSIFWGNKNFSWNGKGIVVSQLEDISRNVSFVDLLKSLEMLSVGFYDKYSAISDENALDKCDGKVAFNLVCNKFAKHFDIKQKHIKTSVYKNSAVMVNTKIHCLFQEIKNKLGIF